MLVTELCHCGPMCDSLWCHFMILYGFLTWELLVSKHNLLLIVGVLLLVAAFMMLCSLFMALCITYPNLVCESNKSTVKHCTLRCLGFLCCIMSDLRSKPTVQNYGWLIPTIPLSPHEIGHISHNTGLWTYICARWWLLNALLDQLWNRLFNCLFTNLCMVVWLQFVCTCMCMLCMCLYVHTSTINSTCIK